MKLCVRNQNQNTNKIFATTRLLEICQKSFYIQNFTFGPNKTKL